MERLKKTKFIFGTLILSMGVGMVFGKEVVLPVSSTINNLVPTVNNTKGEEVFKRLVAGNDKYIQATYNDSFIGESLRKELYENGQKPYAVVLTCADSRVVPEDIFYTGLGEIIVVRVAGNVVDDTVLGTIEFAVDQAKVPLVVVLGHENCGAIAGAMAGNTKGNLGKIIKQVIPSVKKSEEIGGTPKEVYNRAVDFNVENSMKLIEEDKVVKDYIEKQEVTVIGGNYSLETGKVNWLVK